MIRLPTLIPKFDIRWRFEYHDGTAAKYGFWTKDSDQRNVKEMASFQKREGLSRVLIERKCKETKRIDTPVHCIGQDYCLFKWVRVARFGFGSIQGTKKLSSQLVGLTLVTREFEATVLVDGSPVQIEPRSENDKNFHYEGYGR